jgi:hypothetical protein
LQKIYSNIPIDLGTLFPTKLLQDPPENRLSHPEDEGSLFLQVSEKTFPTCYETPQNNNKNSNTNTNTAAADDDNDYDNNNNNSQRVTSTKF